MAESLKKRTAARWKIAGGLWMGESRTARNSAISGHLAHGDLHRICPNSQAWKCPRPLPSRKWTV